MWFIGVEVEQETSAPPPKKNPGSAPVLNVEDNKLFNEESGQRLMGEPLLLTLSSFSCNSLVLYNVF